MPSDQSSEYEYYLRDDRPFQLVVRTRPRRVVFFRSKPITAYTPTEAQLKARTAFAEVARRAKGRRFVGMLPPAAEVVRTELRGRKFTTEFRPPKWLKLLEMLVRG
jgi:hypothetical protein